MIEPINETTPKTNQTIVDTIAESSQTCPYTINELIDNETLSFLKNSIKKIVNKRNWFWIKNVDDVVQDTVLIFIKSYNKGSYSYQGHDKLRGYLTKTAIHHMRTLHKKFTRNREFNYKVNDEQNPSIVDRLVVEIAPAPVDELHDKKKALKYAIAKLNKRRKKVINMTLEGDKVKSICQKTGATPASISGLKFNAIKDLKRIFKEMGFDY